jgi:thiol-disulfide isomerase/thioredoxin
VGTGPPPLALVDPKGRTTRLSDFAGRLVLLHFWGRACAPCLREIPILDGLERRHAGRLKVLHVCGDEDDPADAQKVLDRLAPGAAGLADSTGLGLARYGVRSLPTVWLIAPDGRAVGRCEGAKDWAAAAQVRLIGRWLPPAK